MKQKAHLRTRGRRNIGSLGTQRQHNLRIATAVAGGRPLGPVERPADVAEAGVAAGPGDGVVGEDDVDGGSGAGGVGEDGRHGRVDGHGARDGPEQRRRRHQAAAVVDRFDEVRRPRDVELLDARRHHPGRVVVYQHRVVDRDRVEVGVVAVQEVRDLEACETRASVDLRVRGWDGSGKV